LVVIPEFVPDSVYGELLHNQIGTMLAAALRRRTDVMIALVPMHVHPDVVVAKPSAGEPVS